MVDFAEVRDFITRIFAGALRRQTSAPQSADERVRSVKQNKVIPMNLLRRPSSAADHARRQGEKLRCSTVAKAENTDRDRQMTTGPATLSVHPVSIRDWLELARRIILPCRREHGQKGRINSTRSW